MSESKDSAAPTIGTLNEKPLHADLKRWYYRPGDRLEVPVDGYVVDLVRDGLLVEIQTCGFHPLAGKLRRLSRNHRVRLVHPLPARKTLVKLPASFGEEPVRRRSPKKTRPWEIFGELVHIPRLISVDCFSLELIMVDMEEVRRRDSRRGWRRGGWVVEERRLAEVLEVIRLESPEDLMALLPSGLPRELTTSDISRMTPMPRRMASKAAYCLSRCGCLTRIGKRGRSYLYRRLMGH